MNKHFAIFGILLAIVAVSGCVDQNLEETSLNTPFPLRFAESANINSEDLKITFKKITQDSRCPSDVMCFWRGVATIEIEVFEGNVRTGIFEISDYDAYNYTSNVFAGGYKLILESIEPYPKTTEKISSADYVATIIVSKNTSQYIK